MKAIALEFLVRLIAAAYRKLGRTRAAAQGNVNSVGAVMIPPQVRVSLSGDGLALLEIGKGLVFTCNHTGRRVWRGLVAGRTPAAIAAELSREYGLPEKQIQEHIAEFIADLRVYGLLAAGGRG